MLQDLPFQFKIWIMNKNVKGGFERPVHSLWPSLPCFFLLDLNFNYSDREMNMWCGDGGAHGSPKSLGGREKKNKRKEG